jgi:hypothetical protein
MANSTGFWWVGQDGNVYNQQSDGTATNQGQYLAGGSGGYEAQFASGQGTQISDPSAGGGGGGGGGGGRAVASTQGSQDDLAFLGDQASQLNALLGRADTGLAQGLTRSQDEYDRQLGGANADKALQYDKYAGQRVEQNQGKQTAQTTNNINAGQGYRNLAQIIGRKAGTGSSAFRDLLPNVVGKDLSSKQRNTSETFGKNLQGIDKAQGQYDISFEGVLSDLLRQKKTNEETLRAGIEGQKQGIQSQLADNAGKQAAARGGGYAERRVASQPYLDAINNSRNAVEGFFNQFRTPYVAGKAVAAAPELSGYTTDRAVINAGQGSGDPSNPYAELLRKKLRDGGTA